MNVVIQKDTFDIVIIGGGMVGASLASLLSASQPQLRIALIEAQAFARADEMHFQPSFDARSTALSYGTVAILRELGLWDLLQQHITPIAQVHVSDRGHFLGGVIDAEENNLDAVGYVVENAWLGKVLLEHVQAQHNIQCFASSTVTALTPQQDCALLNVKTNAQEFLIKTSLAVIADGGDSPLRKSLGIGTQVRAYGQTAIITNVEFSEPHHGVAYERFTADGPIALLPLGESNSVQQSALVWTLPAAQADQILALNDADFLIQLQERFGFRVGRFNRVAKRFSYPLQLVLAEEQIRSHLVLLGNAAHFLHPVAGQGFNLALRDCVCLVETLREATEKNKSPGDLAVLQTYIHKQSFDQQITIEFSDKLVRLFSSDQLPLIAMRHLGLLSLESIPLIKNQFIAQTMGNAGRQFRWKLEESNSAAAGDEKIIDSCVRVNADESLNNVDYDVVIVGAGLVGASLACAIAQTDAARNLRIAVIEASSDLPHFSGDHFDPRVVALTHASQKLLSDIGCWDSIVKRRVCAYREMKVWDGEGTAAIEFDCADVKQSHLGHIIENSVVVNQLRERMAQHKNIFLIQPVTVAQVIPAQAEFPRVRVQLTNGGEITAALLIAADGAQSKVRELAEFSTREWDYGQQAIITTVRTERPHEFTAWQRFMHTGPLAFLPLQHNGDAHSCSIVWSAEDDLAAELIALNDEDFCARLTSAFEARLGRVIACDKRYAIPLRQRHATSYIQPGIALVGDAAHNIHPLAGQGVNLGLLDVIALAQEIERALTRAIPLADYSILRRYQRQRLASNLGMMSAMEGFKRLFGNRTLAVNWLRNTGMRQLNSVSAIKKIIINTALGVS
ncbi:2-octaprenyl-6-methoxyphenyl hydroxylase [Cellvibrio fibrivorans]|uniref:2-octaprenylphenol hydroxylase n=1 Tax=Cellvibrio fibrivorans TaxID=126350 RepID=A0ABU1UTE0_9GAMM|nr:2-octaprenyl-6-methoxyphenyl hydroxylase [Cellvibrio fibrivorans]MDR7088446.1 2-octaprenylphenol hydroxylase [Cellvibrio fibrivorans]